MRTYEILDENDHVVRTVDEDDTMRPALLAGQTARLVGVNGEKLAKASRAPIGPGADGVEVKPMPEVLVTEVEAAAARERAKAEKQAAKAENTNGDQASGDHPTT